MTDHRLKNKVFLIVDDDEPQVKLIGKILQMIGAVRVLNATSGPQALEIFRRSRVDFVITDLLMMPMNGFELSRRIRSLPNRNAQEIPIIVSTGYSTLINVEKARDSGVTEVLRKPYMPVDLFHRVLSALDQPRAFVTEPQFRGPDRRRRLETFAVDADRRMTMPEETAVET